MDKESAQPELNDDVESLEREAALEAFAAMKQGIFEANITTNLTVVGESSDKRVRRIENSRTFTRGVEAYRAKTSVSEPSAASKAEKPPLSQVFVRARPLFEHEGERGEWECISGCAHGMTVHEGCEAVRPRHGRVKILRHHQYKQVQRIDSDEGVYKHLRYLVQQASAGRMATLFMYGMTGSGKTYSTNLMFRAAPEELFVAPASGSDFSDTCSGTATLIAYELIGKNCFDLLGADKKQVHLRIGADGATHVQGTTTCEASTPEELQVKLFEASSRRETATTGTNASSSRSHAVYQLRAPHGGSGGTLTIIDLAGNEGSIETAYHTKEQMKEAADINSSLMALRTCLAARASGGKKHVPYRESILTRVLRDAFVAEEAATAVLCCVSPACSHLERTLATLRSAVHLTGQGRPVAPVEEVVKEEGVVKGGPSTWDADALANWVAGQHFSSAPAAESAAESEYSEREGGGETGAVEGAEGVTVTLPKGMTGKEIMKLTAVRLAPLCCDGDKVVGKQLFDALRVAAKEAAARDRETRRALKAGPKPVSSTVFSKSAPSRPVVAAQKR